MLLKDFPYKPSFVGAVFPSQFSAVNRSAGARYAVVRLCDAAVATMTLFSCICTACRARLIQKSSAANAALQTG